MTIKERAIERYLHGWLKSLNGSHRRLKWHGRSKAPDDLCMLPGEHFLAECKKPDWEENAHTRAQFREHDRLRAAGFTVVVFDSLASVDKFMKQYLRRCRG